MAAKLKNAAAFTESLMDIIRLVGQADTDDRMTIADWKALSDFFSGQLTKIALSERQRAMNDIINCAVGPAFGDDRHLKRIIAVHFAGNIAVVNSEEIANYGDEPLTKRRRIEDDATLSDDSDSDNEEDNNGDA